MKYNSLSVLNSSFIPLWSGYWKQEVSSAEVSRFWHFYFLLQLGRLFSRYLAGSFPSVLIQCVCCASQGPLFLPRRCRSSAVRRPGSCRSDGNRHLWHLREPPMGPVWLAIACAQRDKRYYEALYYVLSMLPLVFAFLSNDLNIQYSIAISWKNNIMLIYPALRGKHHLRLNGEL